MRTIVIASPKGGTGKSTLTGHLAIEADQNWLDNLPESLQETTLAERLEEICEYDLSDLEALEPPLGFGRD